MENYWCPTTTLQAKIKTAFVLAFDSQALALRSFGWEAQHLEALRFQCPMLLPGEKQHQKLYGTAGKVQLRIDYKQLSEHQENMEGLIREMLATLREKGGKSQNTSSS